MGSATSEKRRLEDWLTRHMCRGQYLRANIYHVTNAGDSRQKLDSVELGLEGASPDDIADQILAVSERDAGGWTGTQQYTAHLMSGSGEAETSLTWRIRGTAQAGDGETEPATSQGLLAQLMRHLESKERLAASRDTEAIRGLTAALADANRRAEDSDKRRIEYLELIEEQTYNKSKRELEIMKEHRNGEMMQQGFNRLMGLAPIAVEKLFGEGAAKLSASTKDLVLAGNVRDLVRSLSANPKKLEALVMSGTFGPDELAILQHIVTQVQSEADESADREDRIIPPTEESS